jgi:D-glycero-D-manno-heptose 1,7-bisphosphate phosphatase
MTKQLEPQPAIFIDRDGTLIEDEDFLADPAKMRVYDFTREALKLFRDRGFLIIVITNQSGVGRGLLSESDVQSVHTALSLSLPDLIDDYYFCPHAPNDGCRCRKPELGMIEDALRDRRIDIANSWMIGDKKIDIETGFNGGMSTALVMTGYGERNVRELDRMPDIVADNVLEAAREIIGRDDQ